MLRKGISTLLIIVGILMLYISTSKKAMKWISDSRLEKKEWWGAHNTTDGDLACLAYLDAEPKFKSPTDYVFEKHSVDSGDIDLYVWGDSYLAHVPGYVYGGVDQYKFKWRYHGDFVYTLDSNRKNVLVLEIAERYVRYYFSNTDIFKQVYKGDTAVRAIPASEPDEAITFTTVSEALFNPNINQNLEFNLFNYNFVNAVRHGKASLNYHLFARASGGVVISKNKQQLFLGETVEGSRDENSYHPIKDGDVNYMVANMNTIYDHYKQEGFDEVVFSIIPNPATILQPEGSNNLIPRVEKHEWRKFPVISVYDRFMSEKTRVYRAGDTHWNNAGLQIWLAEANKLLLNGNLTVPDP